MSVFKKPVKIRFLTLLVASYHVSVGDQNPVVVCFNNIYS